MDWRIKDPKSLKTKDGKCYTYKSPQEIKFYNFSIGRKEYFDDDRQSQCGIEKSLSAT